MLLAVCVICQYSTSSFLTRHEHAIKLLSGFGFKEGRGTHARGECEVDVLQQPMFPLEYAPMDVIRAVVCWWRSCKDWNAAVKRIKQSYAANKMLCSSRNLGMLSTTTLAISH